MCEDYKSRGQVRGHPTIQTIDKTGKTIKILYEDDLSEIPTKNSDIRSCIKCGEKRDDGIDHCLGKLPGVKNACCGHGNPKYSYISFANGVELRHFTEIDYIKRLVNQEWQKKIR